MCLKRQGKECTWDFFKGIMIFLHYLNSIGEYILKHRNGTKAHILYKSVCLYVWLPDESYAFCFGSKSFLLAERGSKLGREQAFVEILLYSTHTSSILAFFLHKWEGSLISNVQTMKLKPERAILSRVNHLWVTGLGIHLLPTPLDTQDPQF